MPRWLAIERRLTFYLSFSNIGVVSPPGSQFCWYGRARATWESQHRTLTDRTEHVQNCGQSIANIKGVDQDNDDPCVQKSKAHI